MASRSSAPRAFRRGDTQRGRLISLRRTLVRCGLAAVALSLLRCTPDLDSLSSGPGAGAGADLNTAGASGGAIDTRGGASGAATGAQAGSNSGAPGGGAAGAPVPAGGTAGAAAGAGTTAGAGGSPIAGASTGGTGAVTAGAGGEAGEAGSGAIDPCAFTPPNALAYDAFDQGLTGVGFDPVLAVASPSGNGAAVTAAWDSAAGRTCPGALLITSAFKSYASNADTATGDIEFPSANWTGAVALHAWVKINPSTSPLVGVQLFVVSGAGAAKFAGLFDSSRFTFGTWYEMVLPLQADTHFDPSNVLRVGLQVVLKAAGSADIPASPPTTYAVLDDIWVEKAH
jgi:hypothetical protein